MTTQFGQPRTRLINIHDHQDYDIYIGRCDRCQYGTGLHNPHCHPSAGPSIWGNPYSHKPGTLALYQVATVELAITAYRQYLLESPHLLEQLPILTGKILGCWCWPKPCHGQVILSMLDW